MLFPLHLMAGPVIPDNSCRPTIYRHHFKSAPYHGDQHLIRKELGSLIKRIILLIEGFEIPGVNTIKITPSKDSNVALSERAIPYYYNNINDNKNLYKYWNQDFLKTCEHQQNLSFHSMEYSDYLESDEKDQLVNPLRYDLNSFDFFRVEGHLGKNYAGVLQNITQQQQLYNLPFDVVAVKLGKYYDEVALEDYDCYFQDLEGEYRLMREEMQCFASKNGGYFLNLRYASKEKETEAEAGGASGNTVVTAVEFIPMYSIINWTKESKESKKSRKKTKKSGAIANNALVYDFADETVGEIYKREIARKKEMPGKLIMAELAENFSGIHRIPVDGLVTRIQYPLLLADALDELEVTLKETESVRQLNIRELEGDFQKLIRTAEQFSAAIRKNLSNPNLEPLGNEEDIINRLEDIIYNCQVRRFVALRAEYDRRVKKLSEQFLFHNYSSKHPGMEHRGGVPRGGTLVLVYYDQATYRPPRVQIKEERDFGTLTHWRQPAERKRNFSYMSYGEKLEREKETREMERVMATASSFRPSGGLMKLFPDSFNLNLPELDMTRFTNKVVVADFCLDYICCSDSPPVSYVFPPAAEVDLVLTLPQNHFCSPDPQNSRYPFTVNPGGGTLAGPGVEQDENGNFYFNPSAGDVEPGQANFIYTVDGRSVSLSVIVGNTPQLDFVKQTVERTENGLILIMSNQSENAETFIWEVEDEKVLSRNLRLTLPDFTGDKVKVTLRGTTGKCGSSITKEFDVERGVEEVAITEANNRTSFCHDSQEKVALITTPPGGKIKSSRGISFSEFRNGFSFMPAETKPGEYKVVYTSPDGEKAEINLSIVEPDASFALKPLQGANNIIQVQLIPEMKDGSSYEWSVGGQVLSQEPEPKVSLDFSNAHSIVVSLRVTKQGCAAGSAKKANRDNLMRELGNDGRDSNNTNAILDITKKDLTIVETNLKKMSTIPDFKEVISDSSRVFKSNMTFFSSLKKELSKAASLNKVKNSSRNKVLAKEFIMLLNGTAATLAKTRTGRNVQSMLLGLYRMQLDLAVDLIALQEKDLKANDPMMEVFSRVESHHTLLMRRQINLNANRSLTTQLKSNLQLLKGKNNVLTRTKKLIEKMA